MKLFSKARKSRSKKVAPPPTLQKLQYFVGIGAHKAGTSWLAHYLHKHPQVCVSPVKEMHFFDAYLNEDLREEVDRLFLGIIRKTLDSLDGEGRIESLKTVQKFAERMKMEWTPESYREYFRKCAKKEPLAGEITPSYALMDRMGFEFIEKTLPGVRLLFIMRSPAERCWSSFKYQNRNSKYSEVASLPEFIETLALPHTVGRTDYIRTIDEVLAVIPPAQLHTLFYEDLFDPESSQDTLNKITDYLEIDFIPPDYDAKINATPEVKMPDSFRKAAVERFRHVYHSIKAFTRGRLPQQWEDDLST